MTDLVFEPIAAIFSPVFVKGKAEPKKLPRYVVKQNGEVIGWIGQRLERQQKIATGSRVALRSWESPRWYYEVKDRPGQRFGGYITRKDASTALLRNNRVR